MRRFLGALCAITILLLATGCDPRSRDQAVAHGQDAWDSARSALGVAFGSVMEEAQKLTSKSSKEALESSRAAVLELQGKLAEVKVPSELEKIRMEALDQELQRLEAAINWNDLKSKADAVFEEAVRHGKALGRTIEEKRMYLREKDPAFKALEEKLMAAERGYTEAANKSAELMSREQELKVARSK